MNTTKTDLLLLPGLLCDEAVWSGLIKRMKPTRCEVPDYGMAGSISAMAEIVLRQAPRTFVLAGHSMGGRVALEICRQAPERVTHLILLDTGFQPRSDGELGKNEESARLALLAQAREKGMRSMGVTWLQGMVHPDRNKDEELIESILRMIERKSPDIFDAQIQALLARPDATEDLPKINCPTLLICGRQDAWSPLGRHEEMAQLIPGSTLAVIEEAGHMSPMERPAEVALEIRNWWRSSNEPFLFL